VVELAGGDLVELLAGEADVAEVGWAIDLGDRISYVLSTLCQQARTDCSLVHAVQKLLTCCTINVFTSTERSMKLFRGAMLPFLYPIALNKCLKEFAIQ
jgi:hypothetical protein